MCLAQGHNAVKPVRLQPAAHRSRVKHSTTEPLRSLCSCYMQQNISYVLSAIHMKFKPGPEVIKLFSIAQLS